MKFGCHISIAKGFERAAKRAYELGASSFQVFTKNPRSLRSKKLNLDDAQKGVSFCQEHGLTLVAHTPYITNLSTPKEDLHQLTIRSIQEDLKIATAYGAVGAVVHCGKHVGQGEAAGKKKMIETLNRILEDYQGSAKLLLENTAGQGSELGLTIEELVEIREATDRKNRSGSVLILVMVLLLGFGRKSLLRSWFRKWSGQAISTISLLSISMIAKQSFEAVKIVTRKLVKGRLVQMRCRVFCIHLHLKSCPLF